VTDRTYRRLPGRYRFQRRGQVSVKGMGEMITYFQLGGNQRSADRPRSAEHTLAGPQNKQHSRQTNHAGTPKSVFPTLGWLAGIRRKRGCSWAMPPPDPLL
jgi:hypothetical protein